MQPQSRIARQKRIRSVKEWLLLEQKIISAVSAAHRIPIMAKKRKTQSSPVSLLDPSSLKTFFNTPAGRQLMADIVMAAAGVAAAALLASNRGGKAMGKAAMSKAQEAVMGVISTALSGKR